MGLSHAGDDGLYAGKTALTRRRGDAESTLEVGLGLSRGFSALVHSSQYGDSQNRNCLMKIMEPWRLLYRERWKSSGLHHLMKSLWWKENHLDIFWFISPPKVKTRHTNPY